MLWIRLVSWFLGFAGLAMISEWPRLRLSRDLPAGTQTALRVETLRPVAEVDPRFLSVAVDIANVVGGAFWDRSRNAAIMGTEPVAAYDFSRPRLRTLAGALAPAYLRVGGTDADRTLYEVAGGDRAVSAENQWLLSRKQWDALNEFALALDFRVIFTLNVGVGARTAEGRWDPESARGLIADAVAREYPVDVWELGNELNVFPLLHRSWLPPSSYADDMQLARWLLDEVAPEARLAGPAVAYWPLIGEGLPFASRFMRSGAKLLDIVTWHYYPEQSFRCPVATNRAHAGQVLRPGELAEVERWAERVESLRGRHNPLAEVWLGETGGAQCGGEPELSDRFGSSLWWVDQLGRMARRGQPVVVRQALSGGNYGLIDDDTLEPNPDYWASLLWRRLMGTRVLAVEASAETALQSYAHCTRDADGAVTLALVNVHPGQSTRVTLPALNGPAQIYLVQAPSPKARKVSLNGHPLRLTAAGELPALEPKPVRGPVVEMPPLSYAFVRFPEAGAAACALTP